MAELWGEGIGLRRGRLSDQVRETLVARILDGALKPGSRLPAEPALAEAFGVSIPVIREAVGSLVRENVVDRRQGRGTFIRGDALDWLREPARVQGTLAVVASYLQGADYFGQVCEQLSRAATDAGWLLLFVGTAGLSRAEVVGQISAASAEGTIWVEGQPPTDPGLLADLWGSRPLVLFNSPAADSGIGAVLNNDREGAAMVVRHLCDAGHQRICFATNWLNWDLHALRLEGARAAARERGLGDDALEVFALEDFKPTPDERARFREVIQTCSAVFFSSAFLFQFLSGEILRAGLAVPDQVAIVTYDDFADLEAWDPPVTAVRQQIDQMARGAVAMLADMAHRLPVRPLERVFLPSLVVRESTAGARAGGKQAGGPT